MNHFKKNDGKYLVIVSCCLIVIISLAIGCSKNSITASTIEKPKEQSTTKVVAAALAAPVNTRVVVFNGGNESIYHSFRIPSIIKTKNGTLVAFAEGRRWSPSDYGDINVVYKRSVNNGASWSALGEVVGSGAGTWGNPTAVYDPTVGEYGRIWLFLQWNDEFKAQWSDFKAWGDRKIHTSYSDDDGVTWSVPLDRTSTLTPLTYKWDCVGPGIGIRTAYDHPGRLIVPAYGRNIYSDDHGATWQYEPTAGGTDESTIVELMNGSLMRNDRPGTTEWNLSKTRRKSVGSIAGGFPAFSTVAALPDPKCEGSILRYNTDDPNRIIFLNPNGTGQRCNMTVRISYDDGVTWPRSRALYPTANCNYTSSTIVYGGYSSMVKTADYCIGALIEYNEDVQNSATSNKSIEFNKFNLAWILNGSTEP
ncbi:glycoside hydrolase [Pedobacter ginsengisoli]|uniref:exo-alpha-sialidase n=1 Tax=Pedobacter ginsengisoli TaxID=363852 RepID=A0A2D1UCD5_9SPHI|nr:sialidase family protein [Pedobacter ginsengisoli]ATP59239.1 glycoside hydrolase [Pedobacter ginsengisoli]